jgi:DNA-binding MarR family transcriptional regulator
MTPVTAAQSDGLLWELGELYSLLLRTSAGLRDPDHLTATQRLVLIEVAVNGPMRVCDLADRLDTTPATASRAVDRLEHHGFAQRCTDAADGRSMQIVATSKGQRWIARRRKRLRELLDELPANVASPRMTGEIARLNQALRDATGHTQPAAGALLAS